MITPDKWIILRLTKNKKTIYKVLAGWSGDYTTGQSWKINSGILKVSKDGDFFLFEGASGSIYKCHKNGYGTNLITSAILSKIQSDPEIKDCVDVLPYQDFSNLPC